LKSIGEKFDTAPAMKVPAELPGKVAEIDPQPTGTVDQGWAGWRGGDADVRLVWV
jgi:penicillin-binding protein 1A